ncbi:hypothetical protein DYI37_13110 [Fulvimarina endophytica]|uniref:Uncharacterized protein n=1 Tax=Fulvimarina endophytica TaxID=2293836 RepID=A0A371X0Y7_9HYPH|nr:hypothetical protein [Fulvimarina endophytica]RFC62891.1 hypothetical protein DYI37_13110 [Fulvimarina endophytica]
MAERDDTAPKGGDKPAGTIDPDILSEDQIASDRMGDNKLQAKDQIAQHNERKAQAGVKREPDENTLDAFRKMDDK